MVSACGGGTIMLRTSVSPASTADFLTYTDTTNGYSIKYPPNWEAKEGGDLAAVLFLSPREGASDDFQENVNVLVQDIPDDMTLSQYTDQSIREGKNLITGFTVLRSEAITLGGRPGTRMSYRGRLGRQRLDFEAAWLVESGTAFVITFTGEGDSFTRFLGQAEAIISSFALT